MKCPLHSVRIKGFLRSLFTAWIDGIYLLESKLPEEIKFKIMMRWMSGKTKSGELGCHMTPTTHSLNKLLKDKYESVSLVLNVK